MDIELQPAHPLDPLAVKLNDQMSEEVMGRYADGGDRPPAEARDDLGPPSGLALIALVDGEPAGFGGIRQLDADIAEIKRMFVIPQRRGYRNRKTPPSAH